jgi:hypothetical protein
MNPWSIRVSKLSGSNSLQALAVMFLAVPSASAASIARTVPLLPESESASLAFLGSGLIALGILGRKRLNRRP